MQLLAMGESQTQAALGGLLPLKIRYSTVTGHFLQSEPSTDPSSFNFTKTNFGLIDRAYDSDAIYDPGRTQTQWQRFEYFVRSLNNQSQGNAQYKVLFLGRHGEGYHNIAEKYYGTEAWDHYWSKLDGNGTITWADAHLTDTGIGQAMLVNAFWRAQLAVHKTPAPESYYTSPLTRCLATAKYTFVDAGLPRDRPFVPVVKELAREVIGIHSCDRRSSKSSIMDHYPTYAIEPGFTEHDELWRPDVRETARDVVARLQRLLDDVFAHDRNTFISLTAHSGAIAAILAAVGHRPFPLRTGAAIPVLVKAERG